MIGVDACMGLLEIPVCCLEGKMINTWVWWQHCFYVGSVSFCFVYFQMTPTANRRHHTRNLVHGKLAADATSNHCTARYSKTCVKIIQTTIYNASRRSPNIRHNFVGRAVGSERSEVLRGSQLLQKMLSCSLLICFLFWDSSIRQFMANTSILVKQLEGIINFSFCDI